MHERVRQLLRIGYVQAPVTRNGVAFYERLDGGQEQPILYSKRDGEERSVVIDPNQLSADGSIAMDFFHPSHDARLLAYGLSSGGSERGTLYVRDLSTGTVLADSIHNVRYPGVCWLSNNSGFYYSRYPAPGSVPEGDEAYYRRIYFHALGTDPADDPLVFGEGRPKENWPGCVLSADDRWLVVFDFTSFTKTDVFVLDRTRGTWRTIVDDVEATFTGDVAGNTLYMLTNHGGPRFRIVSVDLTARGATVFNEVVPEDTSSTLADFTLAGNLILTNRQRDVISHVEVYDHSGALQGEIAVPVGSVHSLKGDAADSIAYFDFSSFFIPPKVYRYSTVTGALATFDSISTDLDIAAYETHQVMYPSKDGTLVPMFLVHKRGITLDGTNPTLLYGYGGFGSTLTPNFTRNRFLWMERGGVYAQAGIRGGGEYGEDWHRAGMLENKQNSFDDFIAAAEWLIANGYTSPEKLVIRGGSNGGLLVGAVTMQRPELFRVVLCGAPYLDMLRFHLANFGRLHMTEYGNPEEQEAFQYLYAYSPYHNVRPGTAYPAILFTASDTDTRVHYMHTLKTLARLQAANTSSHPIAMRIETNIGHGWGASRSRVTDEIADEWTFVFRELNISMD